MGCGVARQCSRNRCLAAGTLRISVETAEAQLVEPACSCLLPASDSALSEPNGPPVPSGDGDARRNSQDRPNGGSGSGAGGATRPTPAQVVASIVDSSRSAGPWSARLWERRVAGLEAAAWLPEVEAELSDCPPELNRAAEMLKCKW